MPTSSNVTPSKTSSAISPFVRRFLKRVQNTVAQYELCQPGESFIVAVSGGPDSLCLLDVLFLLSKKEDFRLHIAHVNYRLRGKDSDQDEALVRAQGAAYGLSLSVLRPKKPAPANLEETLRTIRYRFFEKLHLEKRATRIAVAHHEDDQAETLLLRLLRGSGLSGLSAMRPKNGVVVRPLIAMSREDILRYLTDRHIPYRIDTSNTDPRFLRNKVRSSLIPLLEKDYQPRIKKILAHTASLLALDYQFFETSFSLPHVLSGPDTLFSVKKLLQYEEAPLKHQFRLLFAPLCEKKSPPKGIIDEFMKLLKSTKSKHQQLSFRGLKIERKGDTVRLLDFHP